MEILFGLLFLIALGVFISFTIAPFYALAAIVRTIKEEKPQYPKAQPPEPISLPETADLASNESQWRVSIPFLINIDVMMDVKPFGHVSLIAHSGTDREAEIHLTAKEMQRMIALYEKQTGR